MPFRNVSFAPNFCYHVFNRGSEKRILFLYEKDYNNFLERVKDNLKKYSISLLSFCLLPNHFHFLLQQKSEASVAKFMNALLLGYAKYFNTKYERVGPLFQGRFKAKIIENDEYLLQLSKYIHCNPLSSSSGNHTDSRNFLSTYHYSSYSDYLGTKTWPFVETELILSYFSKNNPQLSYKSFVEETKVDLETLAPFVLED
ncbi:MAG: transposase [Patescibacteria group bacterium]|nr:transposase [Patescibacteria group bacterium]MCL5095839.1 transposase [Patescibacteria group bacterium]